MHDLSHPLYLPLFTLHILGVVVFFGGLVASLYWKLSADRGGDPAFAARVHARLRKMDAHLVGPGALATFVGGYAMVRFLGGRIAQHAFVLWGLILMFAALALWYFGMRRLGDRLVDESEALEKNRQPLGPAYAKLSAGWVGFAFGSVALVALTVVFMIFKIPGA